jgi:uncharacterized membrane protein YkvA (DUF1232 family)
MGGRAPGSPEAGTELPCAVPERYLEQAARPGTLARLAERLPGKLRRLSDARLVGLAREAFGYATHPAISARHKLLAAAGLLYLLAPMDAISDFIPGLGYLDDAAVLAALVATVREAAKEVVSHTRAAAEEVVSHALSEAREAWARRGVGQVCLSLWAATLAASIGLLYTGARASLAGGKAALPLHDPFFWACLAAGGLGVASTLAFARRVWARWAAAPAGTREPLARALVSLADARQVALLALPVLALLAIVLARSAL